MDVFELLHNPTVMRSRSVIFFHAQYNYPALFFSVFFQHIKKRHNIPVETIDLTMQDSALVIGKLETSFLGQTAIYWLRNISEVPVKTRKEILTYVARYTGPNCIVFFGYGTDVGSLKSSLDIHIPEEIHAQQFIALATTLYEMQEPYARQCAPLMKQLSIKLDEACLVIQYFLLIGSKNVVSFTREWLDRLIKPKSSLLILSKHFFAKDARSFLPIWLQLSKQYPTQFWIAFWSEQLWSATVYVSSMRINDRTEAKKVANRLPVTFLQKNWRDYSIRELKKAHDCIYALDHAIKNWGGEYGLDLFYSQFFQNQLG
jgi:hypothetical protein